MIFLTLRDQGGAELPFEILQQQIQNLFCHLVKYQLSEIVPEQLIHAKGKF